ncbi:hypothetical protein TRFO_26891 [Tritrichomonas foetus]|uniref:Uncharacterized protein n=1 Tax=Tritrichomonas foetus TaxID=1144522 RepID=A0A1J4K3J7_9EUKA|nr:hypothetical protein TRFO_26891 [Tritrichomonas foetus]|eukprot:OHT05408.1 hypothetical protein TRFO_26891 [Tritrichomonas foetus]
MEYIRQLPKEPDFRVSDLTDALSKIETEIIDDYESLNFNKERQFIQDLFSIANTTDFKMSNDRWDILKFNILSFIIAHYPTIYQIPKMSLNTAYGPLYHILIKFLSVKKTPDTAQIVAAQTKKILDTLLSEHTSPYHFYVRSCATYATMLPSLLTSFDKPGKKNSQEVFGPLFDNIMKKCEEESKRELKDQGTVSPSVYFNNPNYVMIFEYIYLHSLRCCNFRLSQKDPDYSPLMLKLLKFNHRSSSSLLHLYFYKYNLERSKSLSPEDTALLAAILYRNARMRVNDFFKHSSTHNIPFEYFPEMDSPKTIFQTLRFLCQYLYIPNQINVLRSWQAKGKETDSKFIGFLIRRADNNTRISLFYFLEQLAASIGVITESLKSIKAIKVGSYKKNIIYFNEQFIENEPNPLDQFLYSKLIYESYETFEEAYKAYEKYCKYTNFVMNRFPMPFHFLQKFFNVIGKSATANDTTLDDKQVNSMIIFYIKRLLQVLFKFLIELSYRELFILLFHNEVTSKIKNSKIASKTNQFESAINTFYRKIQEHLIKKMNSDYLNLFAKIIARKLFTASRKRKISFYFVKHLQNILPTNIIYKITNYMLHILYENTMLIDEFNLEKANDFHQYLYLVLKIGGRANSHIPPRNEFSLLLRNYQKMFLNVLLSRYKSTNQREFLNSMTQYIRIMTENADEMLKEQYRNVAFKMHLKLYRPQLYDHRQEIKKLAAPLMLDNFVIDFQNHTSIPTSLVIYLIYGYTSKQPDLIHKALENSLHFLLSTKEETIKSNEQQIFDSDTEFYRPFYIAMFKSIRKSHKEDALQLMHSIPQLLRLFHSWRTNVSVQQVGYILSCYQVDFINVLKTILANFNGKETEALHMVILIQTFIEANDDYSEYPISLLEQIINNLTALLGFELIRDRVIALFNKLNSLFAPIVSSGNYNYIIALIYGVLCSYSVASALYVNIISSFVSLLNITVKEASKIVDKFFTLYKAPHNINGILTLFLLIQKKYPGSITNVHLNLYLIILSNSPFFLNTSPNLYMKPFNEFLKTFIENLLPEHKSYFTHIAISFIKFKSLNLNFRRSLIKRLHEAKVESPYKDYNHLQRIQLREFYSIFAATLACGVQNNQPIPIDIIDRSVNDIKKSDSPNNANVSMEYIMRLCFIQMVFKTQPPNSPFFEKKRINQFIMFFIHVFPYHIFEKKIKKCIEILKEKIPMCVENFVASIQSSYLKTPNLDGTLKIVRHNAALFPEIIKAEHIKSFLNKVLDYTSQSNEKRIEGFMEIVGHTNFLRIPNYSTETQFRQIFMEKRDQMSNLAHLIHFFLQLFIDNTQPYYYIFYDHAQTILYHFKEETLNCILSHPYKNEVEMAYDFLYDLINDDKTNDFFKLLLAKFQTEISRNVAKIHPALFCVMKKLCKQERFSKFPSVDRILLILYSQLFKRSQTENTDNLYAQMNILFATLLNIVRNNLIYDNIIGLTKYFYPWVINSPLYKKYKRKIFHNRERSFYSENFFRILEDNERIKNYSTVGILLVQCARGMKEFFQEENESFFSTIKPMLSNPMKIGFIVSTLVVYFKFNKPARLNLSITLATFGPALAQPDPYPIIQVFKLANRLLELESLPNYVLSDLLQHVLTFFKFLEYPYSQYVTPLFQKADKIFKDNVPEELSNELTYFISSRFGFCSSGAFLNINLQSLLTLFQLIPNLMKCAPSSIIYSLIHTLDLSSQQMRNGIFKPEDNIFIISYCVKFMAFLNVSQKLEEYFCKYAFNFFKEVILASDNENPRTIDAFLFNLMRKSKYVTNEIFEALEMKAAKSKKLYLYKFALLATENADIYILLNHLVFIQESFEKIMEQLRKINNSPNEHKGIDRKKAEIKNLLPILRTYVSSIFNREELTKTQLPQQFFDLLDEFRNNVDEIETRREILLFYVNNANHHEKLAQLTKFWDLILLTQYPQTAAIWPKSLIKCIECLPYDHQSDYLRIILKRTKYNRKVLYPTMITNFLKSEKVVNSVKHEFLKCIPKLINHFDLLMIDNCYESVSNLQIDTFSYQVLLLFYSIIRTNTSSKLIKFTKLRSMIGNNEEDRYIALCKAIPALSWTNDNLMYFALAIMDDCSFNKPLLMLGHLLSSISSDFFSRILMRFVTSHTLPIMHDLLKNCLSQKVVENYSQIISSITQAFHSCSIHILPNLLYKCVKTTNNYHLFSFDENMTNIPDKLLYPHKLNDNIFGSVFKNVSIETYAASAQFFLGNYEEANKIYDTLPNYENHISERLAQISTDILLKKDTFQIFTRIDHDDSLLIPSLKKAAKLANSKADVEDPLSRADHCNILYIKHHLHLSHYERERISSIEIIKNDIRSKVQGTKSSIPSFIINSCYPPVLSKFITDYSAKLSNTYKEVTFLPCNNNNDKERNSDEQNCIIFSCEYRKCFNEITSIDSHGFFSVKWSAIDQAMTIASSDQILWPSFCFNLFSALEKMIPQIYKTSLESYLTTISKVPMPPFLNASFSARILSLFNLAYNNAASDASIIQIANDMCDLIDPKSASLHFKNWMPQIVDIQSNSRFQQQTSFLEYTLSYATTAHSRSMPFPKEYQIKISTFEKITQIAHCIFSINMSHFENGQTMETLNFAMLTDPEKSAYNNFIGLINQLNRSTPFDYEIRSTFSKLLILQFHHDFSRLSENRITFTCSTLNKPHQRLIIERIDDSDVSITFSNVIESLKNVLKYNYSSRVRRIRLSSQPITCLNKNFIIYTTSNDIMILPNDLRSQMLSKYSPKDFFKLRKLLLSSFAAFSVIQNVFSLDQPKPNEIYISPSSAEFPVMIGSLKIQEQIGETATRITESMTNFFGSSLDGELILSIAAASSSFNVNIDSVRSYIEIALMTNSCNVSNDHDMKLDIFKKRDLFDKSIMHLAPPFSEGATAKDSIEWMERITRFVENSKNNFERIIFDDKEPLLTFSGILPDDMPNEPEPEEVSTYGSNQTFQTNENDDDAFEDWF